MKIAQKISRPNSPYYGCFEVALQGGTLFRGASAKQVEADAIAEAERAMVDLRAIQYKTPAIHFLNGFYVLVYPTGQDDWTYTAPRTIGEPLSHCTLAGSKTQQEATSRALEHLRQMDPDYIPNSYAQTGAK